MTEERFREFFAAHFADVWRFARRRTESDAEADDIAAEAFAVAWRRRADVPADAARLWLFGVARHVLSNHRRQAERGRRLYLRLATVEAPAAAYADAPPSEQAVWAALAALSEDDRELLLLRAWDGLAVADIAVVLGITAANVSSRLHKAKARLRRELDRRDPDAGGHVPDESHARKEQRP